MSPANWYAPQTKTDAAGSLGSSCRCRISEGFMLQAHRGGLVRDVVIGAPTDKCHLARAQVCRRFGVIEPQPCAALHHGVRRQLDSAGQAQTPPRAGHRSREGTSRRSGPGSDDPERHPRDESFTQKNARTKHWFAYMGPAG